MKYPYLIILLIFFSLFGCATRDISTPSRALIGHWQNHPEKLEFYFSSDGIFTSPTGLDLSTPFTIAEENLKNRTLTIKMLEKSFKLTYGYEILSLHFAFNFSPDFTSFTGSAYESRGVSWDPEFEERTEMFKIHSRYINEEEKPPEQ